MYSYTSAPVFFINLLHSFFSFVLVLIEHHSILLNILPHIFQTLILKSNNWTAIVCGHDFPQWFVLWKLRISFHWNKGQCNWFQVYTWLLSVTYKSQKRLLYKWYPYVEAAFSFDKGRLVVSSKSIHQSLQ